MENAISVQNLYYKCKDRLLLNNITFSVKKGSFVSVIGSSGSGKTLLAKCIAGNLNFTGNVKIFDEFVNADNYEKFSNYVGAIFNDYNNRFAVGTVKEELQFSLDNLNLNDDEIAERLNKFINYLEIDGLLNLPYNNLSCGQKKLIDIIIVLLKEPKILILDDALEQLDCVNFNKVLDLFLKINEEDGVTIIDFTHNINSTIFSDRIIVLDNGKILLDDTKENVYLEEKKLKNLGLNLPFMADLSKRLSYYGLVDSCILYMDEMIDRLWK